VLPKTALKIDVNLGIFLAYRRTSAQQQTRIDNFFFGFAKLAHALLISLPRTPLSAADRFA